MNDFVLLKYFKLMATAGGFKVFALITQLKWELNSGDGLNESTQHIVFYTFLG